MHRIVEYFVYGTLLYYLTRVHNYNVVCHLGYNAEVVGDKHDGGAAILLNLLKKLKNLALNRNVESCGGLVGDDELRITCKSDSDHYSLSHTAGKLVRIVVNHRLWHGNAYRREHFDSLCSRLFLCCLGIVEIKDLFDLIAYGKYRVKRGHRLLEYHGDVSASDTAHVERGHLCYVVTSVTALAVLTELA